MKKTSIAIVCMALGVLFGAGVVFAEPIPVRVNVNGSELILDQPAVIVNDRTLVPIRAISEELGANVEWDDAAETITVTRYDITVTIQIGSNILIRNGEQITLDVPAQIIGGRTLVPLRAIAESFGVEVDWDSSTSTALINGDDVGVSFSEANINSAGLFDGRYELAGGDIRTILGIDDYTLGTVSSYDLGYEYNLVHYVQWQVIDTLGQEIRLSHFGVTTLGNVFGTQTGDALFVTMTSEITGGRPRGGPVEESRWLYIDTGYAENIDSTSPSRWYRVFQLD